MSSAAHAVSLTARRSARFVAWARAWRAGLVPFDDALDTITTDEEHLAVEVPGTWTELPLREAMPHLSRLHPDEIRLALPAPGDPGGLGPGELTGAALLAGEAVLAGTIGFVPSVREHTSGSGMTFAIVCWTAYPLPQTVAHGPKPTVRQADAELSQALAATTEELARLDVARWRPELAGALTALRRPTEVVDLPEGYEAAARRLYARATMLDQVVALAGDSAPGGAINAFEAQRRDEALRPLGAACRLALVTACNSPLTSVS
ncbi:hypothetical protein F4553_002577 [Allocatelliglobosispora scoriae]|uniref:Uncharacterized protein n=1 Tax=Allocatelliglobosispora scoriae TaxID=643052 RepID=A0A841BP94_9ACTN|nr:hypothetical protein [Allocatelliglobosispora scoriae]MBB5869198.1 hypothetical protein [Allocatelliglobosispora scoriae]